MTRRTLRIGLIGAGANTRAPAHPRPAGPARRGDRRRLQSPARVHRRRGPRIRHPAHLPSTGRTSSPTPTSTPSSSAPGRTCTAHHPGGPGGRQARPDRGAHEHERGRGPPHARRRPPHPQLVTQVVPSPVRPQGPRRHARADRRRLPRRAARGAGLQPRRRPWPMPRRRCRGGRTLALSGFNMLTLGILHETLLRWVPPPVRVRGPGPRPHPHAHRPAERRAPAGRHAGQRAGAGRAGERRSAPSTTSAA